MNFWSLSVLIVKLITLFGILSVGCQSGPSRRQCRELISALQMMGGHISKGSSLIKRLSFENVPTLYTDCIHAQEGIRFKKEFKIFPIKQQVIE